MQLVNKSSMFVCELIYMMKFWILNFMCMLKLYVVNLWTKLRLILGMFRYISNFYEGGYPQILLIIIAKSWSVRMCFRSSNEWKGKFLSFICTIVGLWYTLRLNDKNARTDITTAFHLNDATFTYILLEYSCVK